MRLGDWEARLQRYVSANQSRRFSYGAWDCALFVCGAIEAMTGTDPAAWFRGRYASRREARAAMREYSGTANFYKFFEYMACELKLPEVPMKNARRGDVVLAETEGRCTLGLVALDGLRLLIAGDTLGFVGLEKGVRAWRA